MLGRAPSAGLPASLQGVQSDVLLYQGYGGGSVPANTLVSLQPGSGTAIGPEVSFGRAIADLYPDESIALIKYAQGGTNLYSQWDPASGSQYNAFNNTVSAGISALEAAGHTPQIIGMLWHQGESDATVAQAGNYESNLTDFISDVRTRYGSNLPFLIGEIRRINANSDIVADAQVAVAGADPFAEFIPANDLTFKDSLHFDMAGQVALGERFAAASIIDINYVSEPIDPPDPTTPMMTHYSFDTDYSDSSGNEKHGTHVDTGTQGNSGITTTPGEFIFGTGAVGFNSDTDNDHVDIPLQTFAPGAEWSVSVWAKKAAADNNGMIIGQSSNTENFIWLNDSFDGLRWRSNTPGTSNQVDFVSPKDTDWHHYVVVAEDADGGGTVNDVSLYVDGSFVSTGFNRGTTAINLDQIGAAYSNLGGFTFVGQIDELWIFNEAIDAETVTSLYETNTVPSSIELPGDINGDDTVDESDLVEFMTYYGTNSGSVFTTGDFDGDGKTGLADLLLLKQNFGNSNNAPTPSAVPEPSAIVLCVIGMIGLGLYRRRKR